MQQATNNQPNQSSQQDQESIQSEQQKVQSAQEATLPEQEARQSEQVTKKPEQETRQPEQEIPQARGFNDQQQEQPDYDALTPHQQNLQQHLPAKWLLISLMVAFSVIPGLENTSFSPSIGQLSNELQINIVALQAFFIFAMGIGQLVWGPLLDNWGRKPVTLVCASLGIIANIFFVHVQPGWQVYCFRMWQGFTFAGLGLVASVILKDIYPPRKFIIYNSWITLFYMFAPGLGPFWGGIITSFFGWRAIFYSLTIGLIAALSIYLLKVPETLAQKHKLNYNLSNTWHNYFTILKNPRAISLIAFTAGYSVCIFSFPVIVPSILIKQYQISPLVVGTCFLIPMLTTILGNRLNVYLMRRQWQPRQVWLHASLCQSGCIIFNIVITYFFLSPYTIIMCFAISYFFTGMLLANITSLYLMIFPQMLATANSLLTFARLVIPGCCVFSTALLPNHKGASVIYIDSLIATICTVGTLIYIYITRPYVAKRAQTITSK
ncbi:MFS transporter [Psittacicella hinzii]|nr:MFS transporter [Psittacicella hinzii]